MFRRNKQTYPDHHELRFNLTTTSAGRGGILLSVEIYVESQGWYTWDSYAFRQNWYMPPEGTFIDYKGVEDMKRLGCARMRSIREYLDNGPVRANEHLGTYREGEC